MAEQMRFITEHSSIAKQMGKEGRRRVEANYSWSNFFKDFDEIARKVAKS
jgi:glycosyltransferase involved in cell wall biosynthesis